MKGQFMVVSAVVAGLTMITVGSVISSIQSQTFEPESTSYDLRYIEDEAERITSDGAPTQLERENYRKLVSELNYRSEVVYRDSENCFDVYLTSSGEQYNLECLPEDTEPPEEETDFSSPPDCSEHGSNTEISNVYDLQCMDEDLTQDYELVENIDASYTEDWEDGFEPIADSTEGFEGSLEGNGNIIEGLYTGVSGGLGDGTGIFNRLEPQAEIRDMEVLRATIEGDRMVGVIAGNNYGATIEQISVENSEIEGRSELGGLVGIQDSDAYIIESRAEVYIEGENENIGGIIGRNPPGSTVKDSYAIGEIYGEGDTAGLVGYNEGDVNNSFSAASISCDGCEEKGLVSEGGDVIESYWDVSASGTDQSDGGIGLGSLGDNPPADEMTGIEAEDYMEGFNFEDVWVAVEEDYPALYWEDIDEEAEGASLYNAPEDCSKKNTPEITDIHELQCVENDLTKDYVLQNDIDASYTEEWEGGFIPIGDELEPFEGSIDGQGYTVEKLEIDLDEEQVGLFGVIGDAGRSESFEMRDAVVSGDGRVGGIAGTNHGEISEISFDGEVDGLNAIGGVAGLNTGDIDNVGVHGTVEGEFEVGGIVGHMSSGTVFEVYATSEVDADNIEGGIIGEFQVGDLTRSYWDVQSTGQDEATSMGTPPEVEGLETDEMQGDDAEHNMEELDFDQTWEITLEYPELQQIN